MDTRRQVKQKKGAIKPHLPKSEKEDQELGKGKKDIVICPDCNATYYFKSWHHSLDEYRSLSEDKKVKFSVCPACQMIKDKKYEGQVILKNIPSKQKQEILNLIKNVGERAYQRDVLDRIIKIKEGSDIEILTTENQLAVSIAKQVKKVFKGKMRVKWSKNESVARAIVELK